MAKGSFNGVITGKKGNTVFFRIKNSNNAEKQGWREYNAKVSNPQSDGQIDQRVKLAAVNNLYRALKPIIQRGWENHKYGDESRRAFLKRALGASFEGPYIEKGSTLAVPIKNVPIMYGSLPPIGCICDVVDGVYLVNVKNTLTITTIGNLSEALITNSVALEGDQVTVVVGSLNADTAAVSYHTISFYVNTADETPTTDYGFTCANQDYEGDDVVTLGTLPGFGGMIAVSAFCAAVSVSRDGDGQHLRSVAEFAMTEAFENYFYGNAATKKAAAKASYIRTRSSNTNWEQVPDSDVVLPVGTTHGMVNSATPERVLINAIRIQDGYTQVYDVTNSIWRFVYCPDVRLTQYQKWMSGDKLTAAMWTGTAPSGAVATAAVRMLSSSDATADDLAFDAWLVENGYNARFIYGNAQ